MEIIDSNKFQNLKKFNDYQNMLRKKKKKNKVRKLFNILKYFKKKLFKLVFKPKNYYSANLIEFIGEIDEFFLKETFIGAKKIVEIKELEEIFCLIELKNGDIITGSNDSKIKIWDLKSKTCLSLLGHDDRVYSIIELNNGDVISGSKDKTIRVWNMKTRMCTSKLKEQKAPIMCLIQLKNGHIASGCETGRIFIWDIEKKICIAKLHTNRSTPKNSYLLQAKTGELISVSFNNKISVWNMNTNTCSAEFETKWIKSFIKSKNGLLLVATNGGTIGKIDVLDVKTKSSSVAIIGPTFTCLLELKEGNLMTGSMDGSLKIFKIENFSCIVTLTGHEGNINCLTQLKNNQVLSGSTDSTVKLWDIRSQMCIGTFNQNCSIHQIKELKHGEIITRSKDNIIRVWKR